MNREKMDPIPKSAGADPSNMLDYIEVGYVAKAHGVRGEVLIRSHWEGSSAVQNSKVLRVLRKGQQPATMRVSARRSSSKGTLVLFEGIGDRDQAEQLKGCSVWLERAQLAPLQEGEYYLSDLVGADVVGPEGKVGVVENIGLYPSVDTLIIRTAEGGKLEQLILDEWIQRIDARSGRIELKSLDGLL